MAMILNSEIQNFKQLKQLLCELWVPEVVDFRKPLQKASWNIYCLWEETHILSLISALN